MNYQISLEVFEGPFDLLLHLIQKEEIDIYDIPIARITDQYLAYLHQMEELDLDIASEFVVMAATLMEIKARMLLPPAPADGEAAAGDEEAIDSRAELVQRLLEYKQFKEAAADLRERAELFSQVYTREPSDIAGLCPPRNPLEGVALTKLMHCFRNLLAHLPEQPATQSITREEVTVRKQITWLAERLQAAPQGLSFSDIFTGQQSKLRVIVTFLALLELVRLREARLEQQDNFAEIMIYPRENEQEAESR